MTIGQPSKVPLTVAYRWSSFWMYAPSSLRFHLYRPIPCWSLFPFSFPFTGPPVHRCHCASLHAHQH
ncbi:hypothetical protein PCANC_18307 [Puccinia coronata f. sp. avenae]|uniref:Uncharacterized protein n=1 Tax=Puccinia coronata f. sp. avenae TaxID=200324 RepID=A0A2N5UQ43_9BASI|nr:hypothetical protein PCANC_18307 [Puccinia coronata f. sp. avenae]PLW39878.1 hypothetical protein PCASD_07887 [Puccinia coronata f. sp. avenae]